MLYVALDLSQYNNLFQQSLNGLSLDISDQCAVVDRQYMV